MAGTASSPGGPRNVSGWCRVALHIVFAGLCFWYLMMLVHESGHVLAAWCTGGRVSQVVWHPLAFSRTDLSQNPNRLIVVWGGPAFGVALPAAFWLVARVAVAKASVHLRAFAGFCLLANGAYLATAIIIPVGDTQELLKLGAPAWLVSGVGLLAFGAGLVCWHGQGRKFWLHGDKVTMRHVALSCGALLVVVAAMLVWSSIV
ncbi:MAG: M50 family metallopeptidase [Phycisphaerales bacterium JB064]